VLRFSYQLPRQVIAPTLRKVIGLHNVEVENPDDVFIALEGYEHGLDFADALHLASSGKAEGFANFDQKMAKRAGTLQTLKIVAP
jgi:predicted nucleic-acid-binding protein